MASGRDRQLPRGDRDEEEVRSVAPVPDPAPLAEADLPRPGELLGSWLARREREKELAEVGR